MSVMVDKYNIYVYSIFEGGGGTTVMSLLFYLTTKSYEKI